MVVALSVVLLLGGCASPSFPDVPEPAGSAPEPVPSGVLYGRVLRQDGRPAPRSTVQEFQLSDEDVARTGLAVMSLGLFCLVPDFCPSPVSAHVDNTGGYSYPADKIKDVPHVTVTARHTPDPGQVVGPEVAASFDHQAGIQQRVPDLRYWEPMVTVRQNGSDATVAWSALTRGGDYAVWTMPADGTAARPQLAAEHISGTSAHIDLRPYEDQPTVVIVGGTVSSTVDGRPVTFAYRAASVALPAVGAPPSRGRPCLIGDPGTPLMSTAAPCPLTDGNLEVNQPVPEACPSATSSACPTPTRHRICVDLGPGRAVSLVAYRTPFLTTGTTVELSNDGVNYHSVGHPAGSDDGPIHVVQIGQPVTATLACLRNDRFGFAGAVLDEVSVW